MEFLLVLFLLAAVFGAPLYLLSKAAQRATSRASLRRAEELNQTGSEDVK